MPKPNQTCVVSSWNWFIFQHWFVTDLKEHRENDVFPRKQAWDQKAPSCVVPVDVLLFNLEGLLRVLALNLHSFHVKCHCSCKSCSKFRHSVLSTTAERSFILFLFFFTDLYLTSLKHIMQFLKQIYREQFTTSDLETMFDTISLLQLVWAHTFKKNKQTNINSWQTLNKQVCSSQAAVYKPQPPWIGPAQTDRAEPAVSVQPGLSVTVQTLPLWPFLMLPATT